MKKCWIFALCVFLAASTLSHADEVRNRKKRLEATRAQFSAANSVCQAMRALKIYYPDGGFASIATLEEQYERVLTVSMMVSLLHWWYSIFQDMTPHDPSALQGRFEELLEYLNGDIAPPGLDYPGFLRLLALGENVEFLSSESFLRCFWTRICSVLGLGNASNIESFRKALESFLNSEHAVDVRHDLVGIARTALVDDDEEGERGGLERVNRAIENVEQVFAAQAGGFYRAMPAAIQYFIEHALPAEFMRDRRAREAREAFYNAAARYQDIRQALLRLYPEYMTGEEGTPPQGIRTAPVAGEEVFDVQGDVVTTPPPDAPQLIEPNLAGVLPPLNPSTLRASITQGGSWPAARL